MKITLEKLQRVRNFPLLAVRVVQEAMPGGFLTATSHDKKKKVIKAAQLENNFRTFIETGTNEGEMIAAVKNCFDHIYSIELDPKLFARASERFVSEKHIQVIQGNSGEVLGRLLESISTPCLFWLDAHYSGGITAKADIETPILQELELIFNHKVKTHVVLIDDAWSFGTMKEYPSISKLRRFVQSKNPRARIAVSKGIIRVDVGP